MPDTFTKKWPLAVHESIFIACKLLSNRRALFTCCGIPRCLANPFPEPVGTIPIIQSLFTKACPTSFTVPSPPTATMMSAFSRQRFIAISVAWLALSVKWMWVSKISEWISLFIFLRMSLFFPVPDIGLMIKWRFFYSFSSSLLWIIRWLYSWI